MPYFPVNASEFRTVWVVVLFDLPVTSKLARRRYAKFRKRLLENGFLKLQFSVYARPFETQESSETVQNSIISEVPPLGNVRILMVTDKQFGTMKSFVGKKQTENEPSYKQILLF
jgi:CRISPR-associated protein Cas2